MTHPPSTSCLNLGSLESRAQAEIVMLTLYWGSASLGQWYGGKMVVRQGKMQTNEMQWVIVLVTQRAAERHSRLFSRFVLPAWVIFLQGLL